jgi:hypothetical protein
MMVLEAWEKHTIVTSTSWRRRLGAAEEAFDDVCHCRLKTPCYGWLVMKMGSEEWRCGVAVVVKVA